MGVKDSISRVTRTQDLFGGLMLFSGVNSKYQNRLTNQHEMYIPLKVQYNRLWAKCG